MAGPLRIRGTLDEPGTVKVNGQALPLLAGNAFETTIDAVPGPNSFAVEATDANGRARTNTYQVNVAPISATYSYDDNGNLSLAAEGSDTHKYEWNAENQLVRVCAADPCTAENLIARFSYDPLGRRASKIAGGVTYTYTYDGQDIVREIHSDGTAYTYVHGLSSDEPLARVDGSGAIAYYHADGLGSIVKMTDQSGATLSNRLYDTWGNLQLGADQPGYSFAGYQWDPEIGLYYVRARYLDSKVGRFISEDPIGFKGGVNRFEYGSDSPSMATDPLGLFAYWCRKGNTVTITLPVKFTGQEGSNPEYADIMEFYRKAIERTWTGQIGKYSTILRAPIAGAGEAYNQFVVGDLKRNAVTNQVGGSIAWTDAIESVSFTYAHEAGHMMGMEERYDPDKDGNPIPRQGYKGNIMATRGGEPWEFNIDEVMAAPTNTQQCGCR